MRFDLTWPLYQPDTCSGAPEQDQDGFEGKVANAYSSLQFLISLNASQNFLAYPFCSSSDPCFMEDSTPKVFRVARLVKNRAMNSSESCFQLLIVFGSNLWNHAMATLHRLEENILHMTASSPM